MGIPMIGCSCPVCTSKSNKDKRLRASGLLSLQNKKILVDCGPDFRQQALKHSIDHLDGVILSHAHHDHTASVDELRVYSMQTGKPVPCLASEVTGEDIKNRFAYIFSPNPKKRLLPKLSLDFFEGERGKCSFQGINFRYFTYEQAGMEVNGIRLGKFAYVTDIHDYPETIFEDLSGVEVLVISALRFTPSHLHLTVDEAIEFSKKVGAKKTWLTHIAHDLQHEKTNAYLPEEIRLAYDGLEISFTGE